MRRKWPASGASSTSASRCLPATGARSAAGSTKAVEAYNKSVGTLEARVLISARKLRELEAAPEGVEIEAIVPVERTTRALQAPALVAVAWDGSGGA